MNRRRRLVTLAKLAFSTGLIVWIASKTDADAVRRSLGRIGSGHFAAAVGLLFLLSAVQAARWIVVAKAMGFQFATRSAWAIVLIGSFFNQVLPSAIGGDAARLWRLHQAGIPAQKALNSIVLDRVVALLAVALIVVSGTPLLIDWADQTLKVLAVVGIAFSAVIVSALLLFLDRLPLATRMGRIGRLAIAIASDARKLFLRVRFMLPAFALSLAIHLGVSIAVWIIAIGMHVDVGLGACLVLVPVVLLLSMVPVSIAGWGVREGAMVVALSLPGVASADALAVSVLFGVAVALSALPGLVIWLLTSKHEGAYVPAMDGTPSDLR